MEETDVETQIDIADDNTTKADEKVDKKLAPITKDDSAPKGGNIVDKVERVEDRVETDKAEPKTAHLKEDTSKKSPNKLVVKDKGTPEFKGNKK